MRMAKLDVSLRLIVMSREPADLVGFVPFHHHTHMPSSTLRLACTLDILILSNLHRNSCMHHRCSRLISLTGGIGVSSSIKHALLANAKMKIGFTKCRHKKMYQVGTAIKSEHT